MTARLDLTTCADRGHRWRWVRTWHELGWVECATGGKPDLAAGQAAAPGMATAVRRPRQVYQITKGST